MMRTLTPNEIAALEAAGLRLVRSKSGEDQAVPENLVIDFGGVPVPAKIPPSMGRDTSEREDP